MYSLDDIRKYLSKFSPKGILIDTCVLILFLIGKLDPNFIEKNDRVSKYSINDFKLLEKIFFIFKDKKFYITPQVIAELSNLTITKKGLAGRALISYLSRVIEFLKTAKEHHQTVDCLYEMKIEILSSFGFTDMTMFEIARKENLPILTEDRRFASYAESNGVAVIYFDRIIASQYQAIIQ